MADVRPELIFLTGPQAGERIVLTSNVILIGRSAQADVTLAEDCTSRTQARLALTADGWAMENLSANGTRVNGQRFKSRKKKVVLGTADVLGVGAETQILFVAAGDDPEPVLRTWREQHPAPPEGPDIEPPPETPPVSTESEDDEHLPPKTERPPAEVSLTAETAARRAKLKKYAGFFVIYLAAIGGLIFLFNTMRGEDSERQGKDNLQLRSKDIAEVFSGVPQRSPTPTRAAAELRNALSLYSNLPSGEGDLYKCVKAFHLYLAYKRQPVFENVQDERKYQQARAELIALVDRKYRNAWAFEQAGDWGKSRDAYEHIMRIVPETDGETVVFKRLGQNVRDHLTYVRGKMRRRRR